MINKGRFGWWFNPLLVLLDSSGLLTVFEWFAHVGLGEELVQGLMWTPEHVDPNWTWLVGPYRKKWHLKCVPTTPTAASCVVMPSCRDDTLTWATHRMSQAFVYKSPSPTLQPKVANGRNWRQDCFLLRYLFGDTTARWSCTFLAEALTDWVWYRWHSLDSSLLWRHSNKYYQNEFKIIWWNLFLISIRQKF